MNYSFLIIIVTASSAVTLAALILLAIKIRKPLWAIHTLYSKGPNSIRATVASEVGKLESKLDDAIISIQNAVAISNLNAEVPIFLGDASIDGFHAKFLVQYLVEHQPKTIVELGSGSSTVLIAQVLRALRIEDLLHVSVDHEARYLEQSRTWATLAGVADRVCFLHAPLGPVEGQSTEWYTGVTAALGNRSIDLVLVDGPPAYQPGFGNARLPALPVLYTHLAPHCTIILDDANRPGEKEIIKQWLSKYPEFTLSRIERGKGVVILSR